MKRRRPRPGRFRFEAPPRRREKLGAALVQGFVQLFLLLALAFLLAAAVRLVRLHFVERYGVQAWILPAAIALITLFLIYRFSRFWRAFLEELREEQEPRRRD